MPVKNDVDENGMSIDMLYIGNENTKMALQKLKAELSRERVENTHMICDVIEENKGGNNQTESSGNNYNGMVVLEYQEDENTMDC